jgi:hypothetical protein
MGLQFEGYKSDRFYGGNLSIDKLAVLFFFYVDERRITPVLLNKCIMGKKFSPNN